MNDPLIKLFGESWYYQLYPVIASGELGNIFNWLYERRSQTQVIPDHHDSNWFRAFQETSYQEVKLVILGQDPYHTPGAFDGLSFSNSTLSRPQPSLANILREVITDVYGGSNPERLANLSLYNWAHQGVLMLNVAHSVEPGTPGCHIDLWDPFTKTVINALNFKNDIGWILWGNFAHKYVQLVKNPSHFVIKGSHPSPMSANRGGFFGGKFFSRANEELEARMIKPIKW